MAHRQYDYAEKTAEILHTLKHAAVPFLAHAAERCGVHRKTAREWVRMGTENPDHELARFATEVRRIQADWIDTQQKRIVDLHEGSKTAHFQAQHLEWIISKLDRETFDPPKQVANVVKDAPLPGEEAEAQPPSQAQIDAAAQALAKAH